MPVYLDYVLAQCRRLLPYLDSQAHALIASSSGAAQAVVQVPHGIGYERLLRTTSAAGPEVTRVWAADGANVLTAPCKLWKRTCAKFL